MYGHYEQGFRFSIDEPSMLATDVDDYFTEMLKMEAKKIELDKEIGEARRRYQEKEKKEEERAERIHRLFYANSQLEEILNIAKADSPFVSIPIPAIEYMRNNEGRFIEQRW